MTLGKAAAGIMLSIVALLIIKLQYLRYASDSGTVGLLQASARAILYSGMIFLFYLLCKFTIEDGRFRTGAKLFWVICDKVILVAAIIYVSMRQDLHNSLSTLYFWILLLVLVDPARVIGRALSQSRVIAEGYFLRGVLIGKAQSVSDYLGVIMVLCVLYSLLLRYH